MKQIFSLLYTLRRFIPLGISQKVNDGRETHVRNALLCLSYFSQIFSRVHTTLYTTMSVGPSIGWSIGPSEITDAAVYTALLHHQWHLLAAFCRAKGFNG